MTDEYDYEQLAEELSAIVDDNDRLAINEGGLLYDIINALEAAAEDGSDSECPVCGQPYANKLGPSKTTGPSPRSDARVCRTTLAGRDSYYIHLPAREGESA